MSNKSKIEWTDTTWNPVRGCSIVSEGCRHCYAMNFAHRFPDRYPGLTKLTPSGPKWTGKIMLIPDKLDEPLRWQKPRRVFVNSMSDLFHEDVPDDFIVKVFAKMMEADRHVFQVLTKRPERMAEFARWLYEDPAWHWVETEQTDILCEKPLPNVWLGVSVEDQKTADERIPLLLQTPAAVRWLSAEPLLGPVEIDFTAISIARETDGYGNAAVPGGIDWVVVGGESGHGARPMHPDWARSIRGECVAADVPFFFKQWGAWAPIDEPDRRYWACIDSDGREHEPGKVSAIDAAKMQRMSIVGKKTAGRELDGRTWDQYPKVAA